MASAQWKDMMVKIVAKRVILKWTAAKMASAQRKDTMAKIVAKKKMHTKDTNINY